MVDDSRLVMRVLQDSIDDGAHALNYTKVKNLTIENDKVCGVAIEDTDNNSVIKLRAAAVINATGAWADRLRNEVNTEKRIRAARQPYYYS